MARYLTGIALIAAASWAGTALCAEPEGQEKLEIESVLSEGVDVLKADMEQAEQGDNKAFTVVTDNNVASLEVDDVYKNNRTYFKVTSINYKGDKGGKFVVRRIRGAEDPGKTWNRVSGLGPLSIESRETLLDRFLSGGHLMYPIALLLITIIIALNSLRIYRRGRQIPRPFVEAARNAIGEGNLQRFEDLALREKGLFGHLCQAMAVDFQTSTVPDIRNRCEIEGTRQVNLLKSPLKTLNFVAAVAPLLGLLGTVIGMIICFESLEGQAASIGKAQAMARGIKMALLTTAAGLSVAVPTLLVYFIFNTRLNLIVAECESRTEEFVHDLATLKRKAARHRSAEVHEAGKEGGE